MIATEVKTMPGGTRSAVSRRSATNGHLATYLDEHLLGHGLLWATSARLFRVEVAAMGENLSTVEL